MQYLHYNQIAAVIYTEIPPLIDQQPIITQGIDLPTSHAHNRMFQYTINNSPSSGVHFQIQLSLLHNWVLILITL